MDLLSELGALYGTDKVHDHHYTPHYHKRFAHLREEPITLLEIGVGGYKDPNEGGASLRMWRDYFTQGTIVGLDLYPKSITEDRISVEQGAQGDPRVLHRLGKTYGPFDIVIDDGSHVVDDILQSWVILWEYVKDGGVYVIEDLGTAYHAQYGGSSSRSGDTTIGFLQGLIDRINHAEFDIPSYTPNRFDLSVVGLEVLHNLAFITKGDNASAASLQPEETEQVFA